MVPAIIPVAGWGTRSLPASKAIPKEMLPIYDRPIVQYVVEEAVAAGARSVIFVTSKGKAAIEEHFKPSPDLEEFLKKKGNSSLLKMVKELSSLVEVKSVIQKEQLGLGHAVLTAREFVGDGHFAVLLGDDLVDATPAGLKQLVDFYNTIRQKNPKAGVVMLGGVSDQDISKYGVCELNSEGRVLRCVEKPKPTETKSRLAIYGRYFLPDDTMDLLSNQKPGAIGELQLTDALQALASEGRLYGCLLKGLRFDAGDRLGFLAGNIHYYLKSELKDEVLRHLRGLLKE